MFKIMLCVYIRKAIRKAILVYKNVITHLTKPPFPILCLHEETQPLHIIELWVFVAIRSQGRIGVRCTAMCHTVMGSSTLSLQWVPCTLPCSLWAGGPTKLCTSKYW
jgi:hypothetical protein